MHLDQRFLEERLKIFLGEKRAKHTLQKARTLAGLEDKSLYRGEESIRFLDAMISCGGMVEFVARNVKVGLLTKPR